MGAKVLVIVARGLHLGYPSCYGNDWVETPAFDRLAAEGVVFDRHYADCPDPEAARRAWQTGRHQIPAEDAGPPPDQSAELFTLLRQQGVSVVEVGGRDAEGAVKRARAALKRLAGAERWLVWLELGSLLPPWDVPEEIQDLYFREAAGEDAEDGEDGEADEDEEPADEGPPPEPLFDPPAGPVDPKDDVLFARLQLSYAAAVTHCDAVLDDLLEHLRETGLLDEMFVVVTADQGLPLGEHGHVGDGVPGLHDELVHLPLVLCLPGREEAGRRVPDLTQPADLMPTLLELFGLPAAAEVHGHSLLPLARGRAETVRAYACSGLRRGDGLEWALRTPEWAFLLPLGPPGKPQLYVKPDDRWEVNDVLQHHLDLAERLEQVLRGFVAAAQKPGPLRPPELRAAVEPPAEG
jgi:arylsulfatase A-like enzyme